MANYNVNFDQTIVVFPKLNNKDAFMKT